MGATVDAAKAYGAAMAATLQRRLGLLDAIVIGLGSMVGAGVFVAFAPAAAAAGPLLWAGLAVALVVAYCNASSSARLAALYPESGGTYVYGRERLGPFWGYLAGWAFVAGKLASCAAMALTVGAYLWPDAMRPVAVAVVAAITALNYVGVHKSALATRVIVSLVLLVLAVAVATTWFGPADHALSAEGSGQPASLLGVLQAAGFLFFAFAGYARIATLGEEVRDPARTIPRAIPLALAITAVVYAAVGLATVRALGIPGLAASTAPLADAVAVSADWLVPVVRTGAVAGGDRVAARTRARCLTHSVRDGPRRPPATCAGTGAPGIPRAAPRRGGRRRGGRPGGPGRRPAPGDRLLLGVRPGLLRHRERQRLDAARGRGARAWSRHWA